ncbi:PHO85 cyclin-5 [Basidiobolus ranarum]|uniref:PHO85 cyclin-5 n=1 Tax=Basidiobolus ranarum TaxID=34480 RepID=A0ABR2W0R5_9FUNG
MNTTASMKSHQFTRTDLIDTLIDETVLFIQYIWPHEGSQVQTIPLRMYIQEILRRSRSSFSTLLTALIYLFRLKTALAKRGKHPDQQESRSQCGRRMFLSAIIVATKFLQDKGIANTAWSRLSGLSVKEINANERIFLELLEYNIFVNSPLFSWWSTLLIDKIDSSPDIPKSLPVDESKLKVILPAPVKSWKKIPQIGYSPYSSIQRKQKLAHLPYSCPNPPPLNMELSPPFVESSSSEDEE